MNCGFRLPTTSGYCVSWDTGKYRELRNGERRAIRDDYYTTDKTKAEEQKSIREKLGFENVKMYECIY